MCITPSKKAVEAKLPPIFGARMQKLHCFKPKLIQQLQLNAQHWATNFNDQADAVRRMAQLAKQFLPACKFCWFNHSFVLWFL